MTKEELLAIANKHAEITDFVDYASGEDMIIFLTVDDLQKFVEEIREQQ